MCILCGESKTVLAARRMRGNNFNGEALQCLNCGLIFISPFPSEGDLDSFYRDNYHYDYFESFDLKQYHESARFNSLRRVKYVFSQKLTTARLRILDVGCGTGSFLEAFAGKNWKTVGIEPSRDCANFARNLGLEVYHVKLEDFKINSERFDVITLWHVLEHFLDPLKMLAKIKSLLSESGILIGEVPNADDYRLTILKNSDFSRFFFHQAHLFYFNRHSLAKVLLRAGFAHHIDVRPISIEGIHGLSRIISGEYRRVSCGQQKIAMGPLADNENKKCSAIRSLISRQASNLLNDLLCLSRKGDNLVFIARK